MEFAMLCLFPGAISQPLWLYHNGGHGAGSSQQEIERIPRPGTGLRAGGNEGIQVLPLPARCSWGRWAESQSDGLHGLH